MKRECFPNLRRKLANSNHHKVNKTDINLLITNKKQAFAGLVTFDAENHNWTLASMNEYVVQIYTNIWAL